MPAHLKKQDDLWSLVVLLKKIAKALIKDDLLLPLRNCRLLFLEVERLSYNGKDMLDILLFVKGRHSTVAECDREFVVINKKTFFFKASVHEYDSITIFLSDLQLRPEYNTNQIYVHQCFICIEEYGQIRTCPLS